MTQILDVTKEVTGVFQTPICCVMEIGGQRPLLSVNKPISQPASHVNILCS